MSRAAMVVINDNVVKQSTTTELLGVIFDLELRWDEHVQQRVKRATKINIAIGEL
jgi:hypothetical protein